MISFPNSKINIGLRVGRKRPDGYHEIESVFYPVPLCDALEIIDEALTPGCVFSSSGKLVEGKPGDNLCVKAYNLLKSEYPNLRGVRMHLHKQIPMGAGLGGGSADAAYTLRLINKKYGLGISTSTLQEYASRLGSDCPFFISNQPALVTGRGEQLKPIALDLSSYKILLVYPGIHVQTGWAFSQVEEDHEPRDLEKLTSEPVQNWRNKIVNDFEAPLHIHYPELKQLGRDLYHAGALFASMSGSGSTYYGIFEKEVELKFPAHYFSKWL